MQGAVVLLCAHEKSPNGGHWSLLVSPNALERARQGGGLQNIAKDGHVARLPLVLHAPPFVRGVFRGALSRSH